ncbi:hypothetical protein AB0D08_15855 [Kitasatospora sp. NPDC048540]|uniref:hypothetical protein n=1 Tax=unclassified Kitasatospora TaxID=2633591 RepID=UPI00053B12B6
MAGDEVEVVAGEGDDEALAGELAQEVGDLAAHTAVNQLVSIVFQVAVGLSHAASINVSRHLALGAYGAARRIRNTAPACGAAVGTLYLALPDLVLRPYFDPHSPADRPSLAITTGLLAGLATTAVLLLRRYGRSLTAREATAPPTAVAATT